jgi:hypothetical protein
MRAISAIPGVGDALRIGSQGRVPIRMFPLYRTFGKYFGYA